MVSYMEEPLSDMEGRVLYLIIEAGSSTISSLANKTHSPASAVEEAAGRLREKQLVEETQDGGLRVTAAGTARWHEVVYLTTEYA